MSREILFLPVALSLVFGAHCARADMTDAQAGALAKAAYLHPRSKNGAAARGKLVAAANAGVPVAQRWRGTLYRSNHHDTKASYWDKKAAAQGDSTAKGDLAVLAGQ